MLCITNNSIKHQSFVYTQSNDQSVLFETIQFNRSHLWPQILNVKHFYLTHRSDPIRCFYSWPEWTWEQWQWKGTLHSIRLFRVISRILIWKFLFLNRDVLGVFYQVGDETAPYIWMIWPTVSQQNIAQAIFLSSSAYCFPTIYLGNITSLG